MGDGPSPRGETRRLRGELVMMQVRDRQGTLLSSLSEEGVRSFACWVPSRMSERAGPTASFPAQVWTNLQASRPQELGQALPLAKRPREL